MKTDLVIITGVLVVWAIGLAVIMRLDQRIAALEKNQTNLLSAVEHLTSSINSHTDSIVTITEILKEQRHDLSVMTGRTMPDENYSYSWLDTGERKE